MKLKIFIIATVLSTGIACKQTKRQDTPVEAIRVKVTQVNHETISLPVRASGILASSKEMKLSFLTGGVIAKIYTKEGDRVKKGEIMAALNLSDIESRVKQASNVYEMSLRDFTRASNLYSDSVATLEQLQNAETAMNIAKSNFDIANYNLNHSMIYAPDDGTVLKLIAEENEIIAQGYPVFYFGSTGNQWKIKAGLSDRDFVRIGIGDSARVTFDAYPGQYFKAFISQVSEAANPLTGTYEIELDLQHTGCRLASGFMANLEIVIQESKKYYHIPVEAIIEAEGQSGYIFIVTGSMTAKKIVVSIAAIYDSYAAISDGLDSITGVVTEGAAYLSEGDKVAIIQ
jgi:multidrug efflux system membrane fusion protein